MRGEEVLALVASHGIRVTLEFGDLRLEADHKPPVEVVDALRGHKEAVVAELGRIAASVEWRRLFEDHVGTVMRERSLSRPEAERVAYDIVVVDLLNASHPDTDPNRCAWCGGAETPSSILLPIGVGARHAWLHDDCWALWRAGRRKAAIEALAIIGIVEPSKDEALL